MRQAHADRARALVTRPQACRDARELKLNAQVQLYVRF